MDEEPRRCSWLFYRLASMHCVLGFLRCSDTVAWLAEGMSGHEKNVAFIPTGTSDGGNRGLTGKSDLTRKLPLNERRW